MSKAYSPALKQGGLLITDPLPAFRVPRGLEGYAPLRALLGHPHQPVLWGRPPLPIPKELTGREPHPQRFLNLTQALKGEVCRSFYH